jgi:ABC-type lipoprotein export system ATPase subunit
MNKSNEIQGTVDAIDGSLVIIRTEQSGFVFASQKLYPDLKVQDQVTIQIKKVPGPKNKADVRSNPYRCSSKI